MNKEEYSKHKENRRIKRKNLKILNIMRIDINSQLLRTSVDKESDKYVNLLSELNAIELNITKLRRNKFNSNFYEFKPSKINLK